MTTHRKPFGHGSRQHHATRTCATGCMAASWRRDHLRRRRRRHGAPSCRRGLSSSWGSPTWCRYLFSMAASNYLGTRTERDELRYWEAVEHRHIDTTPEGEGEEVRQIFRQKGLTGDHLERCGDDHGRPCALGAHHAGRGVRPAATGAESLAGGPSAPSARSCCVG